MALDREDETEAERRPIGNDTQVGTNGRDTLTGTGEDDQLFGLAGRDKLYGGAGDDALFGGKGRDYLHGWTGDNGLFGGGGADTFFIDNGFNYIETGKGHDDVILDFAGGSGDVADFSTRTDQVVLATDTPGKPPSVEDLIADGTLKIDGDASHTSITFGDATLQLLGVALDDFSLDLITVV